ncbi:F0F1 ATP synthase subunit B [Rhizobium sp. L1K21]|uniref:F0F1 ATP synthase subunit B n=1 Tax=Rhizobium sp. L1K21 TaxID=2954933 RepID=UPI002092D4AB|nr:F0F1 ATP synthase subunit B [Rhizobium sp. L1K21]MCO6186932.1 F0F1 ATP synthase subunit B [Rhizobium sp. L1K21]
MDATSLASLWAFIGLLIFLGIVVYLKVPGMIARSLDRRADEITGQLADAKRLREEAQHLLAEYQRKRKEAEEEAQAIVASAKREAASLAAEAKQKTEEYVARRNALAEAKIKQAEDDAIGAVRAAAVDLAISAAESVIASKADSAAQTKLFKSAVDEVKTRMN